MDFFEKAHVVKKNSSRKETKSEEAVKKQLKQMLYGYKHSDTQLIKSCNDTLDLNKFNEDSSSVSGFSDLNLTNSSNEASYNVDSNEENDNLSNVDEQSFNTTLDITDTSKNSSDQIDKEEDVSDNDDKLQTDSDNIRLENLTLDSNSGVSDNDDNSNISSILDSASEIDSLSEVDTNGSEFDADGELAMKILEKLGKKENSQKGVKRKLDTQDVIQHSTEKDNNEEKRKAMKNKENTFSSNIIPDNVSEDVAEADLSADDSNSSAFISIVAAEMPNLSLRDVVGDYKHPTVRNIPSDIQNISTNNSGLFSVEDATVEDIDLIDDGSSSDFLSTIEGNVTGIDTNMESFNDSSGLNDTTVQSEETSELEDTGLNECVNSVSVYYGKHSCIFVMKHPAEIYIHGKAKIQALHGTIDSFGYTLQNKPCEIYAPNYNLVHCIKTVGKENLNDMNELHRKLLTEGLTEVEALDICANLDQYDGVICLRKLHSHKMDFVENNMTGTDLFTKTSKNVDNCFKKASEMLKCSLYLHQPYKVFEEVGTWGQAIECGLKDKSRGIICGGKGVGKSTTLRYFVNQLLARGPVLVVDLDPGQAEFTVAGNISATVVDEPLLGPNFTHLKTPEMMLNLGLINTMDNPRRYATAVGALINHCYNNEQLHAMPWIINTMGMSNAMGLKLMTLIILHIRPTYLLQINSKNPKKSFEVLLDCHAARKLYEDQYKTDYLFRNIKNPKDLDYSFFTAYRSDQPGRTDFSLPSRDERYLNFLSYFGALSTSQNRNVLLGVVPYEVKLEEMYIGLNVKINEDAVTKVINGKIIALCQLTTPSSDKVFTLRDKAILCHGHGLIRGVDLERQMVYIITPMAVDKLSHVNTLVYADWVPELRGQESQLPHGTSVPYRTATTYQKRQLMFAPRRRFNPLQLLKMSRNA